MRKLRYLLCGKLSFVCLLLALLVGGLFLTIFLPALLAPIAAIERFFALLCAVIVCCDGTPAEYKLSKTVLILLLPWTGAVLCFFFLSKPRKTEFEGTMSETPSSQFPLAALSEALCGVGACTLKTAEYFSVGHDMYVRLLEDLRAAKKFIYLEFYIVAEGVFLGDVMEILTRKAAEGVDVRLICDGFGSALTLPSSFGREAERRGVRTLVFRPLRFPSRAAGRRDHRKIVAIDGTIAYTGGVNLADEYIGEKIRFGHWKDTALRVTGGAASALAALFCKTWNENDKTRPLVPPKTAGGGIPCAVLCDSACETTQRAGRQALIKLFAGARKRLYLNTPYLAPDASLMRALESVALSGADVRLMIPHIPDKKLPFRLTRSYAQELEKSGVKVMEYTDGFLHAKSVVSDDVVFVSSYNLDFRSLYLQAECGVAVKNNALADRLASDFLAAWAGGTPLPREGDAARFFGRLLRLAAPLM